MKHAYLLVLFMLFTTVTYAYQTPEPDFRPFLLGAEKLDEYVKKIFVNDFKNWKEHPKGYILRSDVRTIQLKSNGLVITHFYLFGAGFSENKFESYQFITAEIKGGKYVLFQSGLFMPECEGASWDLDKFTFKETRQKDVYIFEGEKKIYGCLGAEEYLTTYSAKYNLKNYHLEELNQTMVRTQ